MFSLVLQVLVHLQKCYMSSKQDPTVWEKLVFRTFTAHLPKGTISKRITSSTQFFLWEYCNKNVYYQNPIMCAMSNWIAIKAKYIINVDVYENRILFIQIQNPINLSGP